MGFLDTFKGNQYKTELDQLKQEHESLKELMTPDIQEAFHIKKEIARLQNMQAAEQKNLDSIQSAINHKNSELASLNHTIQEKKKSLISMDDEILVQEFGLYKPQYDFASALDYKEALAEIRFEQKALIKNKRAVTGNTQWQVNGSSSKGQKMVNDTQKLLLRAFNVECDELISKVRYTNFDSSLNRIYKSAEAISKLGIIMSISITQQYLSAKVKE